MHGFLAGGPLGGAHFTELISVLEGLNKSEDLIDVSANWEIIDANVTHYLVLVDDIGSSEGDSIVITMVNEATISLSNFL